MIDSSLLAALHAISARLEQQPINWAITASCGLALQGVPVSVGDIDLATDQVGAYRIEQLFMNEMIRPVKFSGSDSIQSHYGAFVVAGYEVDIIGETQYRNANGEWDAPGDFTPHKHFMQVDGMTLPVLTLEYEYQSYVRLGRAAKIKLLGEWLGREA